MVSKEEGKMNKAISFSTAATLTVYAVTILLICFARNAALSGYSTVIDGFLLVICLINTLALLVGQHKLTPVGKAALGSVAVLALCCCLGVTESDDCLPVDVARIDILLGTHWVKAIRGRVIDALLAGGYVAIMLLEIVVLRWAISTWRLRQIAS